MTTTNGTPILVNQSALWSMVATFARDALKVAGGYLVTRGVASDSMVDSGAGLIIALVPIVYSQLKTLWNHRKIVTLAEAVPDSVAHVVGPTPVPDVDAAALAAHLKDQAGVGK